MDVLKIENVSKKYVITRTREDPSASLKEIISNYTKKVCRKLIGRSSPLPPVTEDFWALKNINLDIKEGDRVALLGRNGAGKSTLLKLLSRVTCPTKGIVKIRGRLSCLLEVGTGFHPDLTGRENIFFNGSMMGMSYKEIKSKFDEIVAFADIEKFLDTPVKRYSSGMFMRLGFAVAAHLDSDILIVDEVLAVGDKQFQEKCIKKMDEIGSKGNTVLFVSHNINSVMSLCNKGIYLDKGVVKAFEPIDRCIGRYLQNCPKAGIRWKGDCGDDSIRFYNVELRPPSSGLGFYDEGEETFLHIDLEVFKGNPDFILGLSILNSCHTRIAYSRLCDREEYQDFSIVKGRRQISFRLDLGLFHPGEYQIRLDCSLLNKKKILDDDIFLKFAVYSRTTPNKIESGSEKGGISLGNNWTDSSPGSCEEDSVDRIPSTNCSYVNV